MLRILQRSKQFKYIEYYVLCSINVMKIITRNQNIGKSCNELPFAFAFNCGHFKFSKSSFIWKIHWGILVKINKVSLYKNVIVVNYINIFHWLPMQCFYAK
jgi:hypothetical protein